MSILLDERAVPEITSGEEQGVTIPTLVSDQAIHRATALAVVGEAESLSYGQLNSRANRGASHLRSLGVDTDVPVGLCLPRSTDMVVAALGILKAGGAYVPIDPAYPADRIAFMLDDAQAPLMISNFRIAPRLPASKRTLVVTCALS